MMLWGRSEDSVGFFWGWIGLGVREVGMKFSYGFKKVEVEKMKG